MYIVPCSVLYHSATFALTGQRSKVKILFISFSLSLTLTVLPLPACFSYSARDIALSVEDGLHSRSSSFAYHQWSGQPQNTSGTSVFLYLTSQVDKHYALQLAVILWFHAPMQWFADFDPSCIEPFSWNSHLLESRTLPAQIVQINVLAYLKVQLCEVPKACYISR